MNKAQNFDDALRAAKGVTSGFDYLRLGLSLYVLLWHCLSIPDPQDGRFVWDGVFGPLHRAVLPMFFALSGFLVAGSYARNSTAGFVALRAIRIVPALAVEIALSAVAIGVLFTTLPLSQYFASSGFWAYFLNIVGDVHFTLPGVFDGMKINTQLWTLPFEFECYFALVLLSLIGLARRRDLVLALVLFACGLMTYMAVKGDLINNGPAAPRLVFTLSFLGGVVLYMYRDRVPLRLDAFLVSAAASYVFLDAKNLAFLSPLPMAYVTAYLGLMRPPKPPVGDVSYGIYLFHCPILCCLYHLAGPGATWWGLLATGGPLTLLFASLSWRFVERPILLRKALIVKPVERLFAPLARLRPVASRAAAG